MGCPIKAQRQAVLIRKGGRARAPENAPIGNLGGLASARPAGDEKSGHATVAATIRSTNRKNEKRKMKSEE
jgi:hypothetical protein